MPGFDIPTEKTLHGCTFIEELRGRLQRLYNDLHEHHAIVGHRVKGGKVKLKIEIDMVYVNEKDLDDAQWAVITDFTDTLAKYPPLVRPAYVDDNDQFFIDTSKPKDPKPRQLHLFEDPPLTVAELAVDKETGEISPSDPDDGEYTSEKASPETYTGENPV